jgi:hypothetical protein
MFVLLEFLGKMFWLKIPDRDLVCKKKELFLSRIECKNIPLPLIDIFQHLKTLQYEDKPDYELIKTKLLDLATLEENTSGDDVDIQSGNRSPTDTSRKSHSPNTDLRPGENSNSSKRSRSGEHGSDIPGTKRSKH